MANKKVPYAFGIPKKYTDESQGKKVPRSRQAQANLIKRGKEAYEKGEKLPDSYFKARTMTAKGGTKTPQSLAAKAKSSGISLSTLKKVYKRGKGAWLSSGSRTGASMAAWAMGRVNSYIKGSRKHDTDLR